MTCRFGTQAADIVAALGPSIGVCCYVVGESVRDAFRAASSTNEQIGRWFVQGDDGLLRLDLWRANRDQLESAGVTAERIHACGLCTQTHPDLFESYRLDGERAGRMAALIRVP